MPPLALVVCPLPAERKAAAAARALLAALAPDDVVVFCTEPNQAPAAWHHRHRVLPIADLAQERAHGAVAAPLYLHDGGPGEGALQRAAKAVPGVVVDANAPSRPLAELRAAVAAAPGPDAVRGPAGGPRVEVIVLAYKSKDYIAPCLESLLEQDYPDLEITVLDNASGDGTAEYVRRTFASLKVVESPENLGFAAGHNGLFAASRADYVVLLNHDAVARRDFVSELVAAAEARPDGAAFGAKMLMRRCPTILNSTGIVMGESGFAADRDIGRPDLDPRSEPERVFAVCGGAMMLRGAVLRAIGGFDPTFFMYVEDVDWCWRARLAGHEVYYVPTAIVVHDWHGDLAAAGKPHAPEGEAAIAEREGRRRFMVERNRLMTVRKNYDKANLKRVWRELQRYDQGRIAALQNHVARGGGALPARVLEAVQKAHAHCKAHWFSLWRRRAAVQKLRRVADATFLDLVTKGCQEPSGVGDLHAIVDRHCATARVAIAIGAGDTGSLGPGWHHAEPAAHGHAGLRWTMGESWFYVQGDAPWTAVALQLVPQPHDTWAELWIDGVCTQRVAVAQGVPHALRFAAGEAVPAGRLAECRLLCGTFVPRERGMGDDTRELGLHVGAIRLT